jgi:hypothetical protein
MFNPPKIGIKLTDIHMSLVTAGISLGWDEELLVSYKGATEGQVLAGTVTRNY